MASELETRIEAEVTALETMGLGSGPIDVMRSI